MFTGGYIAVHPQPAGLVGKDRVYGTYGNQMLFGYPCSIRTIEIPDGDPRVIDAMGYAGTFRVGELAMHISGFNSYGAKAGAGRIEAIASYEVLWQTPDGRIPREKNASFGGLGCEGPDICAIVGDPMHHAMFHEASYSVTLRGIHQWRKGDYYEYASCAYFGFSPEDVCARVDEVRASGIYPTKFARQKQHTTAIRRLIEDAMRLGASIDGEELIRYDRWRYRWTKRLEQ
jgi:hypothetical protein